MSYLAFPSETLVVVGPASDVNQQAGRACRFLRRRHGRWSAILLSRAEPFNGTHGST